MMLAEVVEFFTSPHRFPIRAAPMRGGMAVLRLAKAVMCRRVHKQRLFEGRPLSSPVLLNGTRRAPRSVPFLLSHLALFARAVVLLKHVQRETSLTCGAVSHVHMLAEQAAIGIYDFNQRHMNVPHTLHMTTSPPCKSWGKRKWYDTEIHGGTEHWQRAWAKHKHNHSNAQDLNEKAAHVQPYGRI